VSTGSLLFTELVISTAATRMGNKIKIKTKAQKYDWNQYRGKRECKW
jgi:hypothetical protein